VLHDASQVRHDAGFAVPERPERQHQLLAELRVLGPGLPALMVGDYNYPVFQNKLDRNMREAGYDLTLSDKRTYTRYKMFRGHFDFATSSGMNIESVRTLDRGTSDHLPILVHAQLDAEAQQQLIDRGAVDLSAA